MSGRVILVGAGPGDPDLLTVRALREIQRAEVLLYDALIPAAILAVADPACERIDAGKRGDGTRGVSQDEITKLMIERARAGRYVVRLKGGDPFLFGRGGEEAAALVDAAVPFEVVPGVSSAFAVPAYAGIPATDRRRAASVAVVTGHRAANTEANPTDWEGLATSVDTLIVLMGTTWLEEIVARVLAGGRDAQTPAAVIAHGTTGAQRVVRAPLAELVRRVREAGLGAPTVTVIGEVARFREALTWYESRPLFGRRVLVLRAEEQRGPLVGALAAAGALPVSVPLLSFEPSGDAAALAVDCDWIVFTSANAVRFAAPHLGSPTGRVACIGAATAAAARAAGFPADVVPEGVSLPETLADALGADLEGVRVLLPQAAEARDTLAEALARRGAAVVRAEVYRNVLPPDAGARLGEVLALGIDAIVLSSPSSVERLRCVVSDEVFAALADRSALVCIGPTTAEALVRAGAEPAAVAEHQSVEGLLVALERHFSEVPHAVPE